jgi:hypothetical protein
MDLINKIESLKDKKLKKEAEDAIRFTLENNDEEFYFEEETIELTSKNYIGDRLMKENGAYYLKDDFKKLTPYCLQCWDKKGQLNTLKKDGNREGKHTICLVCNLQNE